jgi:hypothetical protein
MIVKSNTDERGLKIVLIGFLVMFVGYLISFSDIKLIPSVIAWSGFCIGMIGGVMHLAVVIRRIKNGIKR